MTKTLSSHLFLQVSGESPPAPTRGPNVGGGEEDEEGGGEAGAQAAVSLADLMPKVDISGQIKPDIIKELGDKNWKVRGEALQKVCGKGRRKRGRGERRGGGKGGEERGGREGREKEERFC